MSPAQYRKFFLLILLFGSLFRFGFMLARPIDTIEEMERKRGDEKYYYAIATNLAERGEFTEKYLKAYRPPGYPAFLALDLAIFGRDTRAVQVEQNVLYIAASALFALTIGAVLGGATALVALVLLLLDPEWLLIPQEAYSDTLFIFLLALGVYVYEKSVRRLTWAGALGCGLLMGAAALVREIGLYFGLFLVLYAFVSLWRGKKATAGLRLSGAMLAGILIVVLPWTVRNYRIFHALVPVSTNSTINLYMGNNPKADGEFAWALPPGMQSHWNTKPDSREEILVYRAAGKEAVHYIETHPLRIAQLAVWKAWLMLRPIPIAHSDSMVDYLYRLLRYVHWIPFALLSAYGLWRLRRERLVQIILGMCLIGMGIHILTYYGSRYRAPYEFLLTAPAAYALVYLCLPRFRQRGLSNESDIMTEAAVTAG